MARMGHGSLTLCNLSTPIRACVPGERELLPPVFAWFRDRLIRHCSPAGIVHQRTEVKTRQAMDCERACTVVYPAYWLAAADRLYRLNQHRACLAQDPLDVLLRVVVRSDRTGHRTTFSDPPQESAAKAVHPHLCANSTPTANRD